MGYSLLDKITVKAYDLTTRGVGKEFNLLISDDYYYKFMEEINAKYTFSTKPIQEKRGNITYIKVNGMTFYVIRTDDIKTYKLVAVDGRISGKQDTDDDNGETTGGNPYGD